jgi:hypothetical protein
MSPAMTDYSDMISPGDIIQSYLDGCADFNTPVDEHKLLSALREHGYSIIPTRSVDDWRNAVDTAHAEIAALKEQLDTWKSVGDREGYERGVREAAREAGTMAENPYDCEPEFSAVMAVEAVILNLLPQPKEPK